MALNSFTSPQLLRKFYIFLLLYFLGICLISFIPRGTDQYWSLANVERAVHGDHVLKTNNIFPAGMPDDLHNLPRPWVQNRPVVYIVIVAAFIIRNVQLSWVICNALFLLGTLVLYQRILRYSEINGNHYFLSS